MKHIILLSVLLFYCMQSAYSTCIIIYIYDANGNRIERTLDCSGTTNLWKHAPPHNNTKTPEGLAGSADANSLDGVDSAVENTCSIYPNPNNGYFKAKLGRPVDDADVYLMDVKGSVIEKKKMQGTETDFNISQLPPGVYTLHFISKGYEFSAKIVKD